MDRSLEGKVHKTLGSRTEGKCNNQAKSRNVCITQWETATVDPEDAVELGWAKYCIRSPKEMCPETGRIHYHYYIELSAQQRYSFLKRTFDDDTIHIENRLGSPHQARGYCTRLWFNKKRKEFKMDYTALYEDLHIEAGKMKHGGSRTDWASVYMQIRDGAKYREVCDTHPMLAVRYGSHFKRAIGEFRREKYQGQRIDRQVHIKYGEPGCGKDHTVYEEYGAENVYELGPDESGNIWWDGYEGQDVLLISDFKWWLTRSRLLNLTGSRMCRVNCKCYSEWWTGHTVVITTNYHPSLWYPDSWSGFVDKAFSSRVNSIQKYILQEGEPENCGLPEETIIETPNYRMQHKLRQNSESRASITSRPLRHKDRRKSSITNKCRSNVDGDPEPGARRVMEPNLETPRSTQLLNAQLNALRSKRTKKRFSGRPIE